MNNCEERYESDLLLRFRCEVAPELLAASSTDAALVWDAWKRLFYHWKYNRDIGGGNDFFINRDPDLYFDGPPDVGVIVD